jgi:hypothetical protein
VVVCGSACTEKRIGGVNAPPSNPGCIQAVSLVQSAATERVAGLSSQGGPNYPAAGTEGRWDWRWNMQQ